MFNDRKITIKVFENPSYSVCKFESKWCSKIQISENCYILTLRNILNDKQIRFFFQLCYSLQKCLLFFFQFWWFIQSCLSLSYFKSFFFLAFISLLSLLFYISFHSALLHLVLLLAAFSLRLWNIIPSSLFSFSLFLAS